MSRRILLIAGALVALVAAYVGMVSVLRARAATDEPRRDARAAALARVPGPGSDADRVVLTVELPAEGEPVSAAGDGHGSGCPKTQVASMLGIVIANPHGILVARAVPGGPAAEAGIRAGDSIVACDGKSVTCPLSLLPMLESRDDPRRLELTVLRQAKDGEDPQTSG